MSKEHNDRTLSELHEELFYAGYTSEEIRAHLMEVTWYRYLDTLSPFEALYKQVPQQPQMQQQHTEWVYEDDLTPEEEEMLKEAVAEQEERNEQVVQMRKELDDLRDKVNDVLILDHLHKQTIKDDENNEGKGE